LGKKARWQERASFVSLNPFDKVGMIMKQISASDNYPKRSSKACQFIREFSQQLDF